MDTNTNGPMQYHPEQCSICLENFFDHLENLAFEDLIKQIDKNSVDTDAIQLPKCIYGHFFHKNCLTNMIQIGQSKQTFINCPNCKKIYGIMTGNQPSGNIKVEYDYNSKVPGYDNCNGRLRLYEYREGGGGIENQEKRTLLFNITDPKYQEIRKAYLPYNQEGKQIEALIKQAFERKLIFTIGQSTTSGRENVLIWNGIHMKTNLYGGTAKHGYPDDTYLQRVRQELVDKGVY